MATAIVERNDFSARAPIEHDRPLQNGAGELPAVDQFVIPGRDIPGISQKDHGGREGRRSCFDDVGGYFAATTMISTRYCGAASLASTVARAGVLPGDTQASHTAFISAKFFMSVM